MVDPSNPRPAALAAALALLGAGALALSPAAARSDEAIEVQKGRCSTVLDAAHLRESLILGTLFLLQHQKREGNFTYELDWVEGEYSSDDNSVRQAGAMWGLATIYQEFPGAEVRLAMERALGFFERHSRTTADGARYIVYPGETLGHLGTVALVALAHIDFLRAGAGLSPERRAELETRLDEYLRFLLTARRDEGLFHARYRHEDGTPEGDPSPYYDGESLLALTKAARYLGRDDLRDVVREEAHVGYLRHNVEARRENADSPITKGYYQWSSMVYYELATSGWEDTDRYAFWIIDLADWMIDVHHTLKRRLNTAYAYEGIVPSYELARRSGDDTHRQKFRMVIAKGMAKLTSWQLGHPISNGCIPDDIDDPFARGGVQNHHAEPLLRIDVTQHQMHAVLLARRYVYKF